MSPRSGQAHDPSTRQQISETLSGRHLSKAHRKSISKGKIESFRKQEESNDYHLPAFKRCSLCHKRKSKDKFRRRKKTLKSGIKREYLSPECAACASARSKRWREEKRESGELGDLYRKYELNRSEESKENQRRLNRENDAIKRRDQGAKPQRNRKPIDSEIKVDRMPLVQFMEAEIEKRGLSYEDIARDIPELTAAKVSYLIQGWEPFRRKGKRKGKTRLKWISLHRVDQILRGLDREEELTILYTDEVIDAGLKTQAKEAAQKAARAKAKRRKKAREKYAQKRG